MRGILSLILLFSFPCFLPTALCVSLQSYLPLDRGGYLFISYDDRVSYSYCNGTITTFQNGRFDYSTAIYCKPRASSAGSEAAPCP